MPIKRVKRLTNCEGKEGLSEGGARAEAARKNGLDKPDKHPGKAERWGAYRCKYCRRWHVGRPGQRDR